MLSLKYSTWAGDVKLFVVMSARWHGGCCEQCSNEVSEITRKLARLMLGALRMLVFGTRRRAAAPL